MTRVMPVLQHLVYRKFEHPKHLNGSKLHLNYKGTIALANNFLNFIKI